LTQFCLIKIEPYGSFLLDFLSIFYYNQPRFEKGGIVMFRQGVVMYLSWKRRITASA